MSVLVDDLFFSGCGFLFSHIREHKGYLLIVVLVNMFVDRQVQIHALHELFELRSISIEGLWFVDGKFLAILGWWCICWARLREWSGWCVHFKGIWPSRYRLIDSIRINVRLSRHWSRFVWVVAMHVCKILGWHLHRSVTPFLCFFGHL